MSKLLISCEETIEHNNFEKIGYLSFFTIIIKQTQSAPTKLEKNFKID